MCDPKVFVRLVSSRSEQRRQIDLLLYWKKLNVKGYKLHEGLYEMAIKAQERLCKEANDLKHRDVKSPSSKATESSAVDELCRKAKDEQLSQLEVALICYFAGKFLLDNGHDMMAQNLLLNAYKMAYPVVSVDDIYFLCDIQESLGNLYVKSDLSKAVFWFNGAVKSAGEVTRVPDTVRFCSLFTLMCPRQMIIKDDHIAKINTCHKTKKFLESHSLGWLLPRYTRQQLI